MLSKKPTTDIKLLRLISTDAIKSRRGDQTDMAAEVVRRRYLMLELLRGNSRRDSPVFILTEPRISTPSFSHLSWAERTEENCQGLICRWDIKKKQTCRYNNNKKYFRQTIYPPSTFIPFLERLHRDQNKKGRKTDDCGKAVGVGYCVANEEQKFVQGRFWICNMLQLCQTEHRDELLT